MQPAMPTLVREWLPNRIALRHHRLFRRHADRRDLRTGSRPFPLCCRWSAAAGGSISSSGRCRPASSRRCFILLSPKSSRSPHCRDRDRRPVVAGLEEPAGLAAWASRSAATTARSFADQRFPRRLSRQPRKCCPLGSALGWLNAAQIVAPLSCCFSWRSGCSGARGRFCCSGRAARRFHRDDIRSDRPRHHHLRRRWSASPPR